MIAIDGVDVRGQSQAALFFKNLITGPEGSTVRLNMLRGEASSAFGYELHLFRGTPEYFAGLEQERRNEEALSELKQALAEEQQVAEEVDRIKRLLLAERQERERREKDQEVLHIGTHPHHTPHTYTHTVIHCKTTCCAAGDI